MTTEHELGQIAKDGYPYLCPFGSAEAIESRVSTPDATGDSTADND